MPEFTPGDWMIGRGGSVVAKPPEGCECHQCADASPHDGHTLIDYYGGHVVCETVSGPDAVLIAQAKRLYFAAKSLIESQQADNGKTEADYLAAFKELGTSVDEAEKPYEPMPDAPRPVRPAYRVK